MLHRNISNSTIEVHQVSRIITIVAGVLLGSALLSLVGPVVGEIIATFPPAFPKKGADPLSRLGLPYENVTFPTSDNLMLRGWFIPVDEPNAPAIVYAPGTGHDQVSGLHIVKALHEAGYHVLLFSYRGSGASDGDELSFTYGQAESLDLDASVAFLSEIKGVESVGVIGFSAGAVTAILSAARNPQINIVVAAAPFASVSEVWYTNLPRFLPKWFGELTIRMAEVRNGFRRENIEPINIIHQISPRPLLIIQGEEDSRVTIPQARRLYANAGSPSELWIVSEATHSMVHEQALVSLSPEIIAFLDNGLRPATSTPRVARVPYSASAKRSPPIAAIPLYAGSIAEGD